jgi:hypothetical protein
MTLEHLHEQNRRLRRELASLKGEVESLRKILTGDWSVGVIVYLFAGLTAGIVGSFAGNFIFWSLR